jgi:hypothetical protein
MTLLKVAMLALSLALAAGALTGCDKSGQRQPEKAGPLPNIKGSPQPPPPNLPDQAPPLEKKAPQQSK